mmetsp:Transcript_12902/g.35643  ORF Transcript_12902/g.35643 Transcript_12902/m.35643 type:complete len:87 (+) Transcript_12902:1445-1705(+)
MEKQDTSTYLCICEHSSSSNQANVQVLRSWGTRKMLGALETRDSGENGFAVGPHLGLFQRKMKSAMEGAASREERTARMNERHLCT